MIKLSRQLREDGGGEGGGLEATLPKNIPLGEQGNDPSDFWGSIKPANEPPAPTPPATSAEVIKKEQAEAETLLNKTELTETEKTRLEELKAKYDFKETTEEVQLTQEEKTKRAEVEKKIKEILAKPEDSRTIAEVRYLKENTPPPPPDLYAEVDKLRGVVIPVNYNGVDPKSPEGVLLREEAIADAAIQEYDNRLLASYPRAYEFFKHVQAGGTEETFFKGGGQDFLGIKLSKSDSGLQETIYRQALSLKGITSEQIDALVTVAKDKGKLFEVSNQELTLLQAKQQQETSQRELKAQQEQVRKERAINDFLNTLQGTINKGFAGVVVPLADRQAFLQDVANKTYYENGNIYYSHVVVPQDLDKLLASLYYGYKKGDLSTLIKRYADTLNVERTQGKVKKVTLVPKVTEDEKKVYMPLGQI